MKKSLIRHCLLAAMLALLCLSTQAQDKKTITLHLKNAKRADILNAVKKQVDLEFFFNVDELNRYSTLSISVKNESLSNVLTRVLDGTALKFVIEKNAVTIGTAESFHAVGAPVVREIVPLSGRVTGPNGQPLFGATIMDLGSKAATTTDSNGRFNFTVGMNTTVRISYVGLQSFQTGLRGPGPFSVIQNVKLTEAHAELSGVVITGYQSIDRRNMAGSYSTVKSEDIKIAGVLGVDRLLQGQLPGVAVSSPSGLVGAKTKVRTRGTSTMLGSQDPVWVVDGIIQNDPLPFEYTQFNSLSTEGNLDALKNLIGNSVAFLNVEDIQDITVLKDASSTAIYGVKAANGVIVITTKKGKAGRLSVNYATNMTVSQRPSYRDFNLMNSAQRVDVSKEIYQRGLQFQSAPDQVSYEGALQRLFDKKITQGQFEREVQRYETMNTDWFGLLFRTPLSNNHTISMSGGSDKTTFYTSIGMANQLGNSIGNDMKRYTASVKVNTTFNSRLRVGVNMNGSSSKTNGFYQVDPFRYAYNTSRAMPAYNDDGTPYFYVNSNSFGLSTSSPYRYNIFNERDNTGATNQLTMVSLGYDLEYKVLRALTFQSLGNYSLQSTNGESFATERSNYITGKRGYEYGTALPGSAVYLGSMLPMGGVLNELSMKMTSYTFRNTLSYAPRLRNNRDALVAMAGVEARSVKYDGYLALNYGYLPDRGKSFVQLPLTYTPVGGTAASNTLFSQMLPTVTDKVSNYLSYFATAAYNINQKYILNASIRTDASNRFGQDANHRFLPVWSVGGRWNVAEEALFNKMYWLNQLSIRATYGFQGNVAENYSPELIAQIPTGSGSASVTTGEALLKIKSLAYRDLRWERSNTTNLALDFGILKNRISGTVEYYYKKTSDAIIEKPIPYEYGMVSMPINGGDLENKGYEITLNFVPVRTRDLSWTVRINTAKNFNQVTESGAMALSNWNVAVSGSMYKKGYPVSGFWAFRNAGLDPATGAPTYQGLAKDDAAKVNDATLAMAYAGQLDPKINGGLANNIQYRNWSLNVLFNVSLGQHKFLPSLYSGMLNSAPYPAMNLSSELINRWRQPGDEKRTNIPSIPTANLPYVALPFGASNSTASAYQLYDYSMIRVVDASFVRCQNLSLGYRFGDELLKKTSFARQCLVQASVSNLFYIASRDLHGVDPEVVGNSLPLYRNFSFTLNVGF